MDSYYPPVGFHFRVDFLLPDLTAHDIQFQEVDGLKVNIELENYIEGGENRFVHKLPVRTAYNDLSLKRGLLMDSGITTWIKKAIEKFEFTPANLVVSLLNEEHKPLAIWEVFHVLPIEWAIDSFSSQDSKVVVETLKFSYQYFTAKKG